MKDGNLERLFLRYDIRGKYPEEVNEKFAYRLGLTAGSLFGDFLIGGDNRKTTPKLKEAFSKGLLESGSDVKDIGVSTSALVSFSARKENTHGVMVTASHLDLSWNGFKFLYPHGTSFKNEDNDRLKKAFLEKDFKKKGKGTLEEVSYLGDFLKKAEKLLPEIEGKVHCDCGNGPASLIAPELLERKGAEVERIMCNPKEDFKRKSDPIPENLAHWKGDGLFVGFDLDGDRITSKEKGRFYTGDELFFFFSKVYPDPIVASCDRSYSLDGRKIIETRVGDPFVLNTAYEKKVALCGEPNGHFADLRLTPYNSGPFFSALLSGIERTGYPKLFSETSKIKVEDKKAVIDSMAKRGVEVIHRLDGIKFKLKGAVILVRPSGTEDVVRLKVESRTREGVKNAMEMVRGWI
jgi:phosphomannomutase